MENPMMHHAGGHGSHDMQGMFFIPIPMAMFGVIVSFMFGATLGSMISRRSMMMGGMHGGGMHGGWKHGGWKMGGMGHHHHGEGPPCTCAEGSGEIEELTSGEMK